jgi:hypothetical protein
MRCVTKLFYQEFQRWNTFKESGMPEFTPAALAIRLRAATTFIEK